MASSRAANCDREHSTFQYSKAVRAWLELTLQNCHRHYLVVILEVVLIQRDSNRSFLAAGGPSPTATRPDSAAGAGLGAVGLQGESPLVAVVR